MNRFVDEYWMFAEALLARSSEVLGVSALNELSAGQGYPFGAAVLLSCAGFAAALAGLRLRRPGWGLVGLAVAEELSALSLATAALLHEFDHSLAALRIAALVIAACLLSAYLRRTLRPAPGKAPAGP